MADGRVRMEIRVTHECGGCGSVVRDAYLCAICTAELVSELSDCPSLARELDTQLARMNSPAHGASRPHVEQPEPGVPGVHVQALPYDERAAKARYNLYLTLRVWAPGGTIGRMAGHLLGRIEEIRKHIDAWLLLDQISDATARARRAIDRPGIVRWLPCPAVNATDEPCQGQIRVTADTIMARCDVCGWETDNLGWLGRMLRGDEPALVTAFDACHRLLVEGIQVAPSTIRKWVERGKLEPLACSLDGFRRLLYDLDEIRAVARKLPGH